MVQLTPPPPGPFHPPDEQLRLKLHPQQVRIQVVLFITFLIYVTILLLGRLRSRGNSFMKTVTTNFFMIAGSLLTYIPGLMSAPGESNDQYIFWAAFMAYLAAVTNEITCYTLSDNESRKKRLMVDYSVVWPLILSSLISSLAAPEIIVPIVIIFWIVVLKLKERSRALLYATNSTNGISKATQIISDFILSQKEAGQSNNNSSPSSNFLLGVREAQKLVVKTSKSDFCDHVDATSTLVTSDKFITLGKVMNSEKDLLRNDNPGMDLKNTCTSFAMFWILLAKIGGYNIGDGKTFWGGNELPKDSFNLVQKELEFLYDYLFTNNYAIYQKGYWTKLRDISILVLFSWIALPLLVDYRSEDENILYVNLRGKVLDTGFTRSVIMGIILIDIIHIGFFMTSKWAKVMYTCSYLQNQSKFIQWAIRFTCFLPHPRLFIYGCRIVTKRRIGQYSILKCFREIPYLRWVNCWIGSYFDVPRIGQDGSWDTKLTSTVQDSVVRAINKCLEKKDEGNEITNGVCSLKGDKITNGVCSLKDNMVAEGIIRTYVTKVANQTRVILTWHIATTLLKDDLTKRPANKAKNCDDFLTATTLSDYIAYLVAFFPQMLPDHVYTSQCEFDETVKVLTRVKFKYNDQENSASIGLKGDKTIYGQAQNLKESLEKHEELWKTLAEFWTEMLLFIALADNDKAMEAHANTLCTGGEFITHVWALLTHAGCSREIVSPQSSLVSSVCNTSSPENDTH